MKRALLLAWQQPSQRPPQLTNEKPLHLKHPVSPTGFCLRQPFQTPHLPLEGVFLCFVLHAKLFLCHHLLVPICNSLPFPNKPIFAVLVLGSTLFSRDNTKTYTERKMMWLCGKIWLVQMKFAVVFHTIELFPVIAFATMTLYFFP